MKNVFRKIAAGLLGAVLAVGIVFSAQLPAEAAGIDLHRTGSISVRYQRGGVALAGAEFRLYYASEVSSDGEFSLTGRFADYPVEVNGLDNHELEALASTLYAFAQQDGIAPDDTAATDAGGRVRFGDLKAGLYLLVGMDHRQGDEMYSTDPMMVAIPTRAVLGGRLQYDMELTPKSDREPVSPEEESVTRKALKVWNDEGAADARPEFVEVCLLCDGSIYDTVKLDAENNWRYTWTELDENKVWSVTEIVPEGYTVTIQEEGITFVVTNTPQAQADPDAPDIEEPADPEVPGGGKIPQTGQLWWPVWAMSAAGVGLFFAGCLLKRRSRDD